MRRMDRSNRSIPRRVGTDQAVLASVLAGSCIAVTVDRCGAELNTFISCQSYGNSLPQSRHTTYVPVTAAAEERREPRDVIGKL